VLRHWPGEWGDWMAATGNECARRAGGARTVRTPLSWRWAVLGLLLLAGCSYPVRYKIDSTLCDLSSHPFDEQSPGSADQTPTEPGAQPKDDLQPTDYQEDASLARRPPPPKVSSPERADKGEKTGKPAGTGKPGTPEGAVEPLPEEKMAGREILQVPSNLLRTGPVPRLDLGPPGPERTQRALKVLVPIPEVGPNPQAILPPIGRPLTLADLQRIAMTTSPLLRQAMANVEAARGAAFQAGLPPNPTIGFEDDTFGTTGGAGYVGGYAEQLIKTGNKLQLSRAAAAMDLRNAEVALRRAQMDLATRIRGGYFAVLVARENVRINSVLVHLVTKVYEGQVELVRHGGFEAVYAALYTRVLAVQQLAVLAQARHSYVGAWKQLAANMGAPAMPLYALAGRVDMPMPVFQYDKVLARVLSRHTEVMRAANSLQQARFNLLLAKVNAYPDVDLRVLIQKDYTGLPYEIAPSVAVSLPLPIWNRNQGGIAQAQANLVYAATEPRNVRNTLTGTLAEAFNRYEYNRAVLAYYQNEILPTQVQVYNRLYERFLYGEVGGLNIGDVIVAQQVLSGAISTYVTTLGATWQAVVDVTDFLQTSDMFHIDKELARMECVPPLPNMPPLSGQQPCSPLPEELQNGMNGSWPATMPVPSRPVTFPVPPKTKPAAEEKEAPKPGAGEKGMDNPPDLPPPRQLPPAIPPAPAVPPEQGSPPLIYHGRPFSRQQDGAGG
jgi:cobalt-zinc-cadmium efflux system outer membrane protein